MLKNLMAGITLTNIQKSYGELTVVHDLNLEIEDGSFVVLVGPSGCGKSTTLRMIAGLETITSGEIQIGDKVVNNLPPKDRDIAMVFQNYALYPHMSVEQNMSFALKLLKISQAEREARVQEAAEILGLTSFLKRRPHELSGGQRQRVAMGRAIVRKPRAFLFDEPLSNLDAKLRTQMRIEIKELHHKIKSTIVYVTHDQVEAMTLADKIVVMNQGLIEQQGTPLEIYQKPANTFVASFMGSPPMNLMELEHQNQSLQIDKSNSLNLDTKLEAEQLIAGFRPEDLSLEKGQGNFEFPGEIELVEPLGGETLLHVKHGHHQYTARLGHHPKLGRGDQVQFFLPKEKLSLFDPKTRLRL